MFKGLRTHSPEPPFQMFRLLERTTQYWDKLTVRLCKYAQNEGNNICKTHRMLVLGERWRPRLSGAEGFPSPTFFSRKLVPSLMASWLWFPIMASIMALMAGRRAGGNWGVSSEGRGASEAGAMGRPWAPMPSSQPSGQRVWGQTFASGEIQLVESEKYSCRNQRNTVDRIREIQLKCRS